MLFKNYGFFLKILSSNSLTPTYKFNTIENTKEINKFCFLDKQSDNILKQAVNTLNLSARAYYRILKLSRTIADLAWDKDIKQEHILEALSFRKKGE